MPILESVPAEFTAGDTWRFTVDLTDYPAPTWDATFYAENSDGTFNSTAVDSGSAHAFSIAAAVTTTLVAGRYRWFIRVTDGVIVETADNGWLDVLIDPAVAGKRDWRTVERIIVDNINAFLADPSNIRAASYTIGDRAIQRWPMRDLLELKAQMEATVRTQELGVKAGLGRHIRVRLGRA